MPRILIAEDEAHIAHVLGMWLKQHGYDVVHTGDGEAALSQLAGTDSEEAFDLILSDMNMPGMDGLELARAVRTKLNLKIPFILLSARCDQAKLAADLKPYQVQLYPKPFMPSRLVAEIERCLSVAAS